MARGFVKRMLNKIDSCLNVDSYRYLGGPKRAIGRRRDFEQLKERARALAPADGCIKLHLGCGKHHFDGYINIDLRETSATDLECDIIRLPFDDGTVEVIETYHVIEHLPRHDVPEALKEWRRVLAEGGRLVIECPDFDGAAREYLEGNERRIDNIFGLQRFDGDTHLFGYKFARLKGILEDAGFKNIRQCPPQDYHKEEEPCLRVEACK